MNFREATDLLFSQIDHGALAEKLRVSIASIRQARLKPDALAHRAPPREWEHAVVILAEQQIDRYQKLADTLRKEGERKTRNAKFQMRGRPITD
jgi:hypothetical protein